MTGGTSENLYSMSRLSRSSAAPVRVLLSCSLVLFIAAGLVFSFSAAATGSVTITTGNVTVGNGTSDHSVPVYAYNIPAGPDKGLGCYDFRIDYDNTLVDVTGCGKGGACWDSPDACNPDAGGGTYMLVNDCTGSGECCISPDFEGATGDQVLFYIKFDCLAEGINTWDISVTSFGTCKGVAIPRSVVDGWCNQTSGELPEEEDSGCFIATAALSADDPCVQALRDFRDGYLLTNPVGRALVKAYYRLSPPVAEFISDHPALKPVVRTALMPAVAVSAALLGTTAAQKVAIAASLLALSAAAALRLRGRRRAKII